MAAPTSFPAKLRISAALLLLQGCSAAVNPLDCELSDHWTRSSVPASRPATVSFKGKNWGTAPEKMKLRVRSASSGVSLIGCGLDRDEREWELDVGWGNLPPRVDDPLRIELLDRARIAAGEAWGDDAPRFGGSLLRCGKHGCVAVENSAFTYVYPDGADAHGWTEIRHYDPEAGRFSAVVWVQPASPSRKPPTTIELEIEWDPEQLAGLRGGAAGAGGEGGAR